MGTHFALLYAVAGVGGGGQWTSKAPRDWASEMGLGGILQTFLILGAFIFALVFILSKIDKPRRPPGPDTQN